MNFDIDKFKHGEQLFQQPDNKVFELYLELSKNAEVRLKVLNEDSNHNNIIKHVSMVIENNDYGYDIECLNYYLQNRISQQRLDNTFKDTIEVVHSLRDSHRHRRSIKINQAITDYINFIRANFHKISNNQFEDILNKISSLSKFVSEIFYNELVKVINMYYERISDNEVLVKKFIDKYTVLSIPTKFMKHFETEHVTTILNKGHELPLYYMKCWLEI